VEPSLGLHHGPELATIGISNRNRDVHLAVNGDRARVGKYLVSVLFQHSEEDNFRISLCPSANQFRECTQFLICSPLFGRQPSDTGFESFEPLLRTRLNHNELIHPRRQLLQPNRKIIHPSSQAAESLLCLLLSLSQSGNNRRQSEHLIGEH
jgi:hypothetical protein